MWRLWPKKIDQYISAEFGVFPSKNHDSIAILQATFRENHKKKIVIFRYFILFFCIFLRNCRVELSFQFRNELCMPKYPNDRIFMGFGEKSVFSPNFYPYYIVWRSGGYGPKN